MANAGELTIKVHLKVDLCGGPITHVMEAPAFWSDPPEGEGLQLFIVLDGEKFAKELYPLVVDEFEKRSRAARTGRKL
jgi:hypothetical protein